MKCYIVIELAKGGRLRRSEGVAECDRKADSRLVIMPAVGASGYKRPSPIVSKFTIEMQVYQVCICTRDEPEIQHHDLYI